MKKIFVVLFALVAIISISVACANGSKTGYSTMTSSSGELKHLSSEEVLAFFNDIDVIDAAGVSEKDGVTCYYQFHCENGVIVGNGADSNGNDYQYEFHIMEAIHDN